MRAPCPAWREASGGEKGGEQREKLEEAKKSGRRRIMREVTDGERNERERAFALLAARNFLERRRSV